MATLVKFLYDNSFKEVNAVFPQLKYNKQMYGNDVITCYTHIGQHSSICKDYIKEKCELATEHQYSNLLKELNDIGYTDLKVLNKNEWVCTDIDTKQYCKQISETIFEFKEQRQINPVTRKTETFQATIDLTEYSLEEMIDTCVNNFGYSKDEVIKWIGKENALIAECIFEQLD